MLGFFARGCRAADSLLVALEDEIDSAGVREFRSVAKATVFDIELLNDGADLRIDHAEVEFGASALEHFGLGDGVNMPFLQQVASNQELAKHLQNHEDLVKFFPAIGTVVSSAGGTQAVDQAIIDI